MSIPGFVFCHFDAARRERLILGLKALRLAAKPVTATSEDVVVRAAGTDITLVLAELTTPADPLLRPLLNLKKSRPALSILVVVPPVPEGLGLRLLRDGRVDGIVAAGDDAGLLSLVLCESRRVKSEVAAASRGKTWRKAQAEQARSLRRAEELEQIYDSTLENLMTALDLRDVETFGHSQTVAKYTQVLATLIGLSDETELEYLRRGALLHDIGKIAIPDTILKKPGPLTPGEWEKVRLHPSLGHGLIKEIKLVRVVGNIILHHHERYDGSGYPHGLKGDRIPLEARLFALADALDAITAHRPYRQASDFRSAQKEIVRHSGTQFDPRLVDAFLRLKPEKWEKIRFETTSYIPSIEEFSALARKLGA